MAGAILGTYGLVAVHDVTASFLGALGGDPGPAIGWGLFLAVVLGMWCCGLRLACSMVRFSSSGVLVRNVFRTRRVEWNAVARFTADPGIVVMHLHGGERIAITALAGPNVLFRPQHAFVSKMTERLNADAAQFVLQSKTPAAAATHSPFSA